MVKAANVVVASHTPSCRSSVALGVLEPVALTSPTIRPMDGGPPPPRAPVAGWDALAQGAWAEAQAHFQAAADQGDDAGALEGLSWAAWWLEDVETCIDARERAYLAYRDTGDDRAAARMALWLADDHADLRGEPAVAEGWFSRAARLAADLEPCPEHGWLAVFEAHRALGGGAPGVALRHAVDAVEVGHRHGLVALEMFGVATEGVARLQLGEIDVGLRRLSEAATAAVAGEYEDLVPAAWSCCLLIAACEDLRDYERGAQWCEQVAAFGARTNADFLRGVCRAHHGAILAWRGELREAERVLEAAVASLTERRPTWRPEALVRLGELRRLQGRHADAAALFEAASAHPLAQRGLAAVSLARDDPAGARDLLQRMLRKLPLGDGARRSAALELLVRAELALGDHTAAASHAEELQTIADAVGTEPFHAAASVAAGLLAGASGEHALASDRFEDAIDLLLRCRAPLEAAAVRVDLAETLWLLDRPEVAFREAGVALDVLEGVRPVERKRAEAVLARRGDRQPDDLPLTARQVEVLGLIAEGLSDQEVAERLVLSEHTVHRHVANIYTRLGCSTRAAAVARATRLGLLRG
jgi:LuxR family transcriptional regulator, maltose regulon positive regulatory protein